MTTETYKQQRSAVQMGSVAATRPDFVPPSEWPELEAAREAHERALEEHVSEQARRQDARAQERQLQEHLATVQQSQRQAKEEAAKAVKTATSEALRVVAERGDEWLAKIAADREKALAEHDKLIAKAEALKAEAHKHDRLEAWLRQASTKSIPQPFSSIPDPVTS